MRDIEHMAQEVQAILHHYGINHHIDLFHNSVQEVAAGIRICEVHSKAWAPDEMCTKNADSVSHKQCAIYVNDKFFALPIETQRFVLAHEVAHLLPQVRVHAGMKPPSFERDVLPSLLGIANTMLLGIMLLIPPFAAAVKETFMVPAEWHPLVFFAITHALWYTVFFPLSRKQRRTEYAADACAQRITGTSTAALREIFSSRWWTLPLVAFYLPMITHPAHLLRLRALRSIHVEVPKKTSPALAIQE